jgi:hypothetical protein
VTAERDALSEMLREMARRVVAKRVRAGLDSPESVALHIRSYRAQPAHLSHRILAGLLDPGPGARTGDPNAAGLDSRGFVANRGGLAPRRHWSKRSSITMGM